MANAEVNSMISSDKLASCLFFAALVFVILTQTADASSTNFTVDVEQEVTRTLSLAVEDRVFIHFSVVGGQFENTLNFYITYPNGTVKNYGAIGSLTCRFVCDKDGECVLHFSNADFSESKLVSMDCEVQHYVFGIPQMLFLTMVIVVFCVGAVAVFILRGKPR
jgi:hypothetical protein